MPAKAKTVKIPVMPYYGDEEMCLDFPATWDVHCCQMKGWNAPALTDRQMRKAFANPIGTPTIREMAKGKKEACCREREKRKQCRSRWRNCK